MQPLLQARRPSQQSLLGAPHSSCEPCATQSRQGQLVRGFGLESDSYGVEVSARDGHARAASGRSRHHHLGGGGHRDDHGRCVCGHLDDPGLYHGLVGSHHHDGGDGRHVARDPSLGLGDGVPRRAGSGILSVYAHAHALLDARQQRVTRRRDRWPLHRGGVGAPHDKRGSCRTST